MASPPALQCVKHALPVAEQRRPVASDRPAHLPVLLVDGPGLGQQRGGDFARAIGREAARRPVFIRSSAQNRLTAVGPAGGQVVGRFVKSAKNAASSASGDVLHAQAHAVRGGDPDGRGPADPQHLDRLPNGLHVAALDLDELDRQPRLIDQPQMPVTPPIQCRV